MTIISTPMANTCVSLQKVKDPVYSKEILGKGVAMPLKWYCPEALS